MERTRRCVRLPFGGKVFGFSMLFDVRLMEDWRRPIVDEKAVALKK